MKAEMNTPVGHFMMSLFQLSIDTNMAIIGIDAAADESICVLSIEKNLLPVITDVLGQMTNLNQASLKEDVSYNAVIRHLKNDISFLDEIINDPEIQAKGQKAIGYFSQIKNDLNKILSYLTK